jgi:hypothetical protein
MTGVDPWKGFIGPTIRELGCLGLRGKLEFKKILRMEGMTSKRA